LNFWFPKVITSQRQLLLFIAASVILFPMMAARETPTAQAVITANKQIQRIPVISEETLVADLAILDYQIYRSIDLRLKYLYPNQSTTFLAPEEPQLGLEMADFYTIQAHRNALMNKSVLGDGFMSIDQNLLKRHQFAKLLGLAFFNSDPKCPLFEQEGAARGSCCVKHQMDGWKVLVELLEEVDIPDAEIAQLLTMIIELRTAIVVFGSSSFEEWTTNMEQMFPEAVCNIGRRSQQTQSTQDAQRPEFDEEPDTILGLYQRAFADRKDTVSPSLIRYFYCYSSSCFHYSSQ
jgi:hypothetical protein